MTPAQSAELARLVEAEREAEAAVHQARVRLGGLPCNVFSPEYPAFQAWWARSTERRDFEQEVLGMQCCCIGDCEETASREFNGEPCCEDCCQHKTLEAECALALTPIVRQFLKDHPGRRGVISAALECVSIDMEDLDSEDPPDPVKLPADGARQ